MMCTYMQSTDLYYTAAWALRHGPRGKWVREQAAAAAGRALARWSGGVAVLGLAWATMLHGPEHWGPPEPTYPPRLRVS